MTPPEAETKPCRECGSFDITPGNVRAQNWLCRGCVKAYREAHRSHILRYMRTYHENNYERDLSRMSDWRKTHRSRTRRPAPSTPREHPASR